MEVVIGKTAGFCAGVKNAVEIAKKELINNKKIYCLGELVHNSQVVKELEENGMITVNSIDEIPDGEKVLFRAHGEAKKVYEKAKNKKLEIIDLTCKKVVLIHDKVEKESKDSFIIIIGKKNHPETIGTKGFAGNNSYVVETEDDILTAYINFKKTNLSKVYIVAQTTISSNYFDLLSKKIEEKFIEAVTVIDKTICIATELRQKETMEMSKDFHIMVIIGGKNSSNTKELVKVAEKNCEKVFCVECSDELNEKDFLNIEKVGIMAGASTPNNSIKEIENKLKNYN